MANETTETAVNPTDVLVPAAEHRTVVLGEEPYVMTFVQKPLSFFGKLEVFSVLGTALENAMSGPNGLNLSDIFEGPAQAGDTLNQQNFRDADTFVKAIAKLVQYAPDLLLDLYVIVLAVPRGEREYVKAVMQQPEDQGGLSDEDGFGILETFIDQNWDVMADFFNSRIMPMFNKVSSKVQESQPSKPSKTTRRTTPKR